MKNICRDDTHPQHNTINGTFILKHNLDFDVDDHHLQMKKNQQKNTFEFVLSMH